MSEQTLKELGIELKKLEIKENDILIVEFDIDKIKPKELNEMIKFIKEKNKNKVIGIPDKNSLKFFAYNKDNLLEIQNRFNEYINKILKGEE